MFGTSFNEKEINVKKKKKLSKNKIKMREKCFTKETKIKIISDRF